LQLPASGATISLRVSDFCNEAIIAATEPAPDDRIRLCEDDNYCSSNP
jgi:hypothetical protein